MNACAACHPVLPYALRLTRMPALRPLLSSQMHGMFAKACVAALSELLYLSPNPESLHPATQPFLEQVHAACTTIMSGAPQVIEGMELVWCATACKLLESS